MWVALGSYPTLPQKVHKRGTEGKRAGFGWRESDLRKCCVSGGSGRDPAPRQFWLPGRAIGSRRDSRGRARPKFKYQFLMHDSYFGDPVT